MKVSELIAMARAIEAEHGGDVEVLSEVYGDYLKADPRLVVEPRCVFQYQRDAWLPPDWLGQDEIPLKSAMVCYLTH